MHLHYIPSVFILVCKISFQISVSYHCFLGTGHQRPVFSQGVYPSQHTHKTTNLWKFGLNWWSDLQEGETLLKTLLCVFTFFFLSKTWWLMKLKLLQVIYITFIFIHSEWGFISWPKKLDLQKVSKPFKRLHIIDN